MSLYTDGPWEIVEQNPDSMFVPFAENPFCIVSESGRLIAVGKTQSDKTMGNARLLKAAPAMFEALLVLQEFAHNNWDDENYQDPEHGGWVSMIDAAVREAKGS